VLPSVWSAPTQKDQGDEEVETSPACCSGPTLLPPSAYSRGGQKEGSQGWQACPELAPLDI